MTHCLGNDDGEAHRHNPRMDLNAAAIVIAGLSFATSLWAIRYAKASARAADVLAEIERERLTRETDLQDSANLIVVEAPTREVIQVSNLGQHTASDLRLTYPGLTFRNATEDYDVGLDLAPGEVVEFYPGIDWDHPRNEHMRDHRGGGTMGVPHFPIYLSWTDGLGSHHERRRIRPRDHDLA